MTDHLDRIMQIMEAAFDPRWGEAWTRRQIGDSLLMPHTHYDLVDRDGADPHSPDEAVGFVLSRYAAGEEELLLIAVLPEMRGRGLGKCLLDRLASQARMRGAERLFLEMRENNPAVSLYRAKNFTAVARRKEYYTLSDGSRLDAITFARIL